MACWKIGDPLPAEDPNPYQDDPDGDWWGRDWTGEDGAALTDEPEVTERSLPACFQSTTGTKFDREKGCRRCWCAGIPLDSEQLCAHCELPAKGEAMAYEGDALDLAMKRILKEMAL